MFYLNSLFTIEQRVVFMSPEPDDFEKKVEQSDSEETNSKSIDQSIQEYRDEIAQEKDRFQSLEAKLAKFDIDLKAQLETQREVVKSLKEIVENRSGWEQAVDTLDSAWTIFTNTLDKRFGDGKDLAKTDLDEDRNAYRVAEAVLNVRKKTGSAERGAIEAEKESVAQKLDKAKEKIRTLESQVSKRNDLPKAIRIKANSIEENLRKERLNEQSPLSEASLDNIRKRSEKIISNYESDQGVFKRKINRIDKILTRINNPKIIPEGQSVDSFGREIKNRNKTKGSQYLRIGDLVLWKRNKYKNGNLKGVRYYSMDLATGDFSWQRITGSIDNYIKDEIEKQKETDEFRTLSKNIINQYLKLFGKDPSGQLQETLKNADFEGMVLRLEQMNRYKSILDIYEKVKDSQEAVTLLGRETWFLNDQHKPVMYKPAKKGPKLNAYIYNVEGELEMSYQMDLDLKTWPAEWKALQPVERGYGDSLGDEQTNYEAYTDDHQGRNVRPDLIGGYRNNNYWEVEDAVVENSPHLDTHTKWDGAQWVTADTSDQVWYGGQWKYPDDVAPDALEQVWNGVEWVDKSAKDIYEEDRYESLSDENIASFESRASEDNRFLSLQQIVSVAEQEDLGFQDIEIALKNADKLNEFSNARHYLIQKFLDAKLKSNNHPWQNLNNLMMLFKNELTMSYDSGVYKMKLINDHNFAEYADDINKIISKNNVNGVELGGKANSSRDVIIQLERLLY